MDNQHLQYLRLYQYLTHSIPMATFCTIDRSTDVEREGYLIDNKPSEVDKIGSKEVVLRAKKDSNNIPPRNISAVAIQPEVAGTDTNVSLRVLRKDKKNIVGLV